MSTPSATHSIEAEINRTKNEAIRIRAEAGKAIVATVFRGLVPLGVCGIAVAASAVIIERAAPGLHLAGLLIVWISATLICAVNAISGALEGQRLPWKRLLGEQAVQLEIKEAEKLAKAIQQ